MLGGQRSHVIIERAEEGEPGDEARDTYSVSLWTEICKKLHHHQRVGIVRVQCNVAFHAP